MYDPFEHCCLKHTTVYHCRTIHNTEVDRMQRKTALFRSRRILSAANVKGYLRRMCINLRMNALVFVENEEVLQWCENQLGWIPLQSTGSNSCLTVR